MIVDVEVIATLCMFGYICGIFVFSICLGQFIRKGVTIMREAYLTKEHLEKSMHRFFLFGFLFLGSSLGLSLLLNVPTHFPADVLDAFQHMDVSAKGEMVGILFFGFLFRWFLKKTKSIGLKIASVHAYNQAVEQDSFRQREEPVNANKALERHLHLLKERYDYT